MRTYADDHRPAEIPEYAWLSYMGRSFGSRIDRMAAAVLHPAPDPVVDLLTGTTEAIIEECGEAIFDEGTDAARILRAIKEETRRRCAGDQLEPSDALHDVVVLYVELEWAMVLRDARANIEEQG